MASDTELERLAAAANQLRPEWPTRSLLTYLRNHHATRAYRDLAVALAYVAVDPATQTPARLGESGPWWGLTEEQSRVPAGRRIPCPEHPAQPAGRCADCTKEAVPPPPNWRDRAKEDA